MSHHMRVFHFLVCFSFACSRVVSLDAERHRENANVIGMEDRNSFTFQQPVTCVSITHSLQAGP